MIKRIKKIFKVFLLVLFLFVFGLYIVFVVFTSPKPDNDILKSYKNSTIKPILTYEDFDGFSYRKISIQKDTTLPTLVFVHGTIGSIRDFTKYLSDSLLQTKANMVAYDRIGYNYEDKNSVQESIAFEREHLQNVIKKISSNKIILVGYSYGGPITLSIQEKVKKIILLAPAVYGKVEPMPWMLNFYRWRLTRWLIPRVWQEASKEKLSHPKDLENFESKWRLTKNKVTSIHGSKDWIVPLSNSEFLQKEIPKSQFKLVTIDGAGHGLIWTNFNFIKQQILANLD